MKLPESIQNRLLSLCSNLRITKETHVDEIYMLKLEAESIFADILALEEQRPLSHGGE